MKNRKTLLALLSMAAILVMLFAFTGCNEQHTHSFSEWETVTEPTCTAFGVQKRTCECSYEEVKTLEALPHTPVTDAAVSATCTSAGLTEGSHCGVCKAVLVAQTSTAPEAHSFSDWETVVEPTCTSFGLQKHTCECNYTEYKTTAALQHTSVTDAAVSATCTSAGLTEGSHCGVCKAVLVAQTPTAPAAHGFSEWETVVEPTCTSFGLQKHTCKCNYTEYKTTAALQHTPVTDAAVSATCTSAGLTEGSHCGVCKAVLVAQTTTAPAAHSFSEWETLVAQTCTSFGLQKHACKCGYTEYKTAEALQHTPVADVAVDATCTTDGKTEGSHCGTCGTILTVQNTICAFGHNCDKVTVLTEADCNVEGSKRFACSNDGCTYYYDESYSLDEVSAIEIIKSAKEYVGCIKTYSSGDVPIENASAVVISSDGIIVTSYYALNHAFYATFTLGEKTYDVVKILAYDSVLDLAVLKIDATDLTAATLCEFKPVSGEKVYSIGNALSLSLSIDEGIVSNASFDLGGVGYIHHSADLTDGFRGAPLVNCYGEVVGINLGYYQEKEVRMAIPISYLSKLNYDNPITMEENFNITYTVKDYLVDWVMTFATAYNAGSYYVEHNASKFAFALGYNEPSDYLFIESVIIVEDGSQVRTHIPLVMFPDGTYQYNSVYSNMIFTTEISGFIDPATYGDPNVADSTKLTYDTFYGRYQSEQIIMNACSYCVYETLGWFSYWLDTYFFDITLEDTFGFKSLSFERDEDALEKLNNFVCANGVFDPETGLYSLTMSQRPDDKSTDYFTVSYRPASEGVESETIISICTVFDSGTLQEVSIILNPKESGNRFNVTSASWNGTSYDVISHGWGYIDANSFTDKTSLTCYVFEGYEEYEDLLLGSASSLIVDLLLWADYVMEHVEPGLSIRDLGFLFFVLS